MSASHAVVVIDPDANQLSVSNHVHQPFVIHCVGIEKEADLVPVFVVFLFLIYLS